MKKCDICGYTNSEDAIKCKCGAVLNMYKSRNNIISLLFLIVGVIGLSVAFYVIFYLKIETITGAGNLIVMVSSLPFPVQIILLWVPKFLFLLMSLYFLIIGIRGLMFSESKNKIYKDINQ